MIRNINGLYGDQQDFNSIIEYLDFIHSIGCLDDINIDDLIEGIDYEDITNK